MKEQSEEQQLETKKFQLTKEEQAHLMGKRNIRDLFSYIADLIEKDMTLFIDRVVKPIRSIKPEQQVKVSIENGWLEYDVPIKIKKKGGKNGGRTKTRKV